MVLSTPEQPSVPKEIVDNNQMSQKRREETNLKLESLERSCEKTKTDEEEWNQRMQIWEKKKERLSGSEWDKSFREAAHSRLKCKKPWITPITCPKKNPPCRIDRRTSSPGNSKNCKKCNTIDLMNSHNDEHWEQKSVKSTSKWKQDEKLGKTLLEAVGLKRECSRLEGDNISHVQFHVVQSRSSTQDARPEEVEEFRNKLLKNSDPLMASEKVEDIILERTESIVMTDPVIITQPSTRFVKTILSPIQSVSECSTQTLMDQRSPSFSINNDKQRCGKACAEKSEQCSLSEHTMAKKNIEEREMNMKKQLLSPENRKVLLNSKANSPHRSQNVHGVSEKIEGLSTEPNKSKSEREENKANGADQRTLHNDSLADSITPETAKQIKEILERGRAKQSVKTKGVKTPKMNTAKDSKKNTEYETKPSCLLKTIDSPVNIACHESKLNEEQLKKIPSESKNEDVALLNRSTGKRINKNEKLHTVQRDNVEPANLFEHDVRSGTKRSIDKSDENRIANRKTVSSSSKTATVRELNILPSIAKDNKGEGRKFVKPSHSKERALHAIFSSPDTIFGNCKKPVAQPVFFASVTFEDSSLDVRRLSDDDTRMFLVEGLHSELYELRATARALSDESIMLFDRSLEDLTDTSSEWYREFHRPVVSSEESEAERMPSERFREIIGDRSGCRRSYNGPCQAKNLKNRDNYHLWRYEVCHDASQCSLKKSIGKVTTKRLLRRKYSNRTQ